MTRESYCKDEWFHFEKCLGEHTDLKQIGTNVWKNLEKMKGRDQRTVLSVGQQIVPYIFFLFSGQVLLSFKVR